jgi:hypothetical protein
LKIFSGEKRSDDMRPYIPAGGGADEFSRAGMGTGDQDLQYGPSCQGQSDGKTGISSDEDRSAIWETYLQAGFIITKK